jgi:cytochrome c553
MRVGEAIFMDACSACHLQHGEGQPYAFPPLAQSADVQQADPTTAIHVILAGVRAQPTAAAPTPFTMPAFAWKLDDAQVAAVATYVRNQWGNAAPAVTAAQVAQLRGRLTPDAAYASHAPPTPLSRPGPNTLGTPDTDSRDNGTPRAGRAAPPDVASSAPALPASTASAPASATTGGQAASGA